LQGRLNRHNPPHIFCKYLRNGARYDQGYCDRLTGSRIGLYALSIGAKIDLERPNRHLQK